MKILKNYQWGIYLFSSIVVSIFAFFIHLRDYKPIDLGAFFFWLPAIFSSVFVLSLIFGFICGGND